MSSSVAASSSSTGARRARSRTSGFAGSTSALTTSATLPPISASTKRANVTPARRRLAAWPRARPRPRPALANSWPRAEQQRDAHRQQHDQRELPGADAGRRGRAGRRPRARAATPSASSTRARPRWPTVRPSVMIAETGAKNGRGWPNTSVATSHATDAATAICTIEREASARRSKRGRIESRERSAASSTSSPPRSESSRACSRHTAPDGPRSGRRSRRDLKL